MGGTAALRRDHAGSHGVFRGASFAKELAIEGGFNAPQDVAADATLGLVGRAGIDIKGKFSIEALILGPQRQSAIGNLTYPSPQR